MSAIRHEHRAAPQPTWGLAAIVIVLCLASWFVLAYLMFPVLSRNAFHLALGEGVWFLLWGWGLVQGLSGFRVEITAEGVRQHGLFRDNWIPWTEAEGSDAGVLIKIEGASRVIMVNPFVYRNWKEIEPYIKRRIVPDQGSGTD